MCGFYRGLHLKTGWDTMTQAIERRAREARRWLLEACFPLWAEHGLGPDGAFREHLDMRHRPFDEVIGRVRVQGRQTYLFALAWQMGWQRDRAVALVETGLEVLETRCRRPDGLFAKRIDANGGLEDDTADLYDTAFALFACAHACTVPDTAQRAAALAETTMQAVVAKLSDPHGGFAEALPRPAYRMQNPHMHLLEAMLALNAHHGAPAWAEQARALVSLFETRFFDSQTGTLGEYFGADWLRLSGDRDDIVEPGHQYEWVWLLEQADAALGTDTQDKASALYRFANATLDEHGVPCMSVRRSGAPVDTSRRSWVTTEALKAHITMTRRGDELAPVRLIDSFDQLFDDHLTVEGGWADHLEADGSQRGEKMPASTGYHVALALDELIKMSELS